MNRNTWTWSLYQVSVFVFTAERFKAEHKSSVKNVFVKKLSVKALHRLIMEACETASP